jgi:hypothetical protein
MYNIVENPIPRSGLFATPTLEQISDQIEGFPAVQKSQLYLVMQLTLNACHKLVEEEVLSKEVFAQ